MARSPAKVNRCESENCCPPLPAQCCEEYGNIQAKPALNQEQSRRLAVLFKVLANDTRLRLLHTIIKSDEISVNDLADRLDMKAQAVSNQLQKLVALSVVEARREGNSMLYRVIDPCVLGLLDTGLCLMEDARRRKRGARRITILTEKGA